MKIYVVLLSVFLFSVRCPAQVKYDTVPCVMLVSDTVKHCGYISIDQSGHKNENTCIYNYQSLWEHGYEVRKVDSVWEVVDDPNQHFSNGTTLLALQNGWVKYYTPLSYLDADKHPLTLFVWMSKQL